MLRIATWRNQPPLRLQSLNAKSAATPPTEASAPVWWGGRGWCGSRIAALVTAGNRNICTELLYLNRAGSMLNITSQRQDPEISIFCWKSMLRKIRSHAATSCAQVSLGSTRLIKGYRRKTGPAGLKPIDVASLFLLKLKKNKRTTKIAQKKLSTILYLPKEVPTDFS